jgi:hypothetical protein
MLHAQNRMTKIYDERKMGMHGNKKTYLMLYFIHKYRIAPTTM